MLEDVSIDEVLRSPRCPLVDDQVVERDEAGFDTSDIEEKAIRCQVTRVQGLRVPMSRDPEPRIR